MKLRPFPGATNFRVSHFESGSIPDCLGFDQHELNTLAVEGNELSGPIPESLCQIGESLEQLLLFTNSLTGRESVAYVWMTVQHRNTRVGMM